MRKLILSLAVVMGLLGASGAQATPYSGGWLPTDGDANYFELSFSLTAPVPTSLWMFDGIARDNGDLNGDMVKLLEDNTILGNVTTVKFQFNAIDGNWEVLGPSNNKVLNLQADKTFGLFFEQDGVANYVYDLAPTFNLNQWFLTSPNGAMLVLGTDIAPTNSPVELNPVPVPAAVWLLGSGLLGLLGLRRRV